MVERSHARYFIENLERQARHAKADGKPLPLSSVITTYMLAHDVLGMPAFAAVCFADAAHQQTSLLIYQDWHSRNAIAMPELPEEINSPTTAGIEKTLLKMEAHGADTTFALEAIGEGSSFGEHLFDGSSINIEVLEEAARAANQRANKLTQQQQEEFDRVAGAYMDEIRAWHIIAQVEI